MIDVKRALKVVAVWVSIVYVVCFLGVLLFPGIRPDFLMYALHMKTNLGENVMTIGTFISGIVIWNITAALATWLFVSLWNKIK